MAAKNVWIDDAYEYSGQTLHYCVKMNGNKIYDGIATADDFPIKIYLNRIAQGYLQSTFPQETGTTQDTGAGAAFSLVGKVFNGADWVENSILYCAYYVDAWDGENGQEAASPINGHADPRQRLFHTLYGEISYCGTVESGISETYIDTVEYSGDTATKIIYSGWLSTYSPEAARSYAQDIIDWYVASKDTFSAVTEDGMRLIYPSDAWGAIGISHPVNPGNEYVADYTIYYVFDEPVRFNEGSSTPAGNGHIVTH